MIDTAALRIKANIETDPITGCWVWQRSTTGGYGRVRSNGRLGLVHRVAYRLWVGEPIDGMQIDHLCRNRACCNPAHLEQVTPIVNQLRACPPLTHCRRGHELTPANVYKYRGRRECKACKIDRQRAWREANPNWRTGATSTMPKEEAA